jgi:hypothetical protein
MSLEQIFFLIRRRLVGEGNNRSILTADDIAIIGEIIDNEKGGG